jgi:hypothetical protein
MEGKEVKFGEQRYSGRSSAALDSRRAAADERR